MELRSSAEGCYVRARVKGAPDLVPRAYVGVHTARDEAARAGRGGWALGWVRRLRRCARARSGPLALEPVHEHVRLVLEADGYFARNNVRYCVEGATKKEGRRTARPTPTSTSSP